MSKQSLYKKLVYQSIENALDELNAEDKGRYYICNCPECNQHEAFMYKNNKHFIQCNRENHCGSRMMLAFHEKREPSAYERKKDKQHSNLSNEQREALTWTTRLFSFAKTGLKSKTLDNGYRGISREVARKHVVDLQNQGVVGYMYQKTAPLLGKDYANNSWMRKRNLIFPLYSKNNTIDRILLRSSIDESLEPKEIQLVLNPSKETRDFFVDVPKDAEIVVFSESILDALSFREIDDNAGFIALTGASKTRKVKEYMREQKEKFHDKHILLAFDDDRAGWKTTRDIADAIELEGIGIDWDVFDYTTGFKDANENLQKDRNAFENRYYAKTHQLNKFKQQTVEQTHER